MLSPVILFNGVMGIIGALQVFTIPYIMFPGGSPARSTYFYAMYLYDNAFMYLKMGYACAMGWIMFCNYRCADARLRLQTLAKTCPLLRKLG